MRAEHASVLAVVLAATLFTGCQTTNSAAPGTLASVTILNRPLSDIMATTQTVFIGHGFQGGPSGGGKMTFQKPGSSWDNLQYSTWMNKGITVRAVVNFLPQENNSTVVACNVSLVEDEGAPVLGDSHPVRKSGAKPYQDILNEIQAQLK